VAVRAYLKLSFTVFHPNYGSHCSLSVFAVKCANLRQQAEWERQVGAVALSPLHNRHYRKCFLHQSLHFTRASLSLARALAALVSKLQHFICIFRISRDAKKRNFSIPSSAKMWRWRHRSIRSNVQCLLIRAQARVQLDFIDLDALRWRRWKRRW
jgi:hypothetical protein